MGGLPVDVRKWPVEVLGSVYDVGKPSLDVKEWPVDVGELPVDVGDYLLMWWDRN